MAVLTTLLTGENMEGKSNSNVSDKKVLEIIEDFL